MYLKGLIDKAQYNTNGTKLVSTIALVLKKNHYRSHNSISTITNRNIITDTLFYCAFTMNDYVENYERKKFSLFQYDLYLSRHLKPFITVTYFFSIIRIQARITSDLSNSRCAESWISHFFYHIFHFLTHFLLIINIHIAGDRLNT